LQAAYNVGGHTVSADTIQNAILGCQMPRPGQVVWFVRSCISNLSLTENLKQKKEIGMLLGYL